MRVKKAGLLIKVVCMFYLHFEYVLSMEPARKAQERSIKIVGDQFVLNGQPLHIISGSIQYYRLPAEYWRDRLQKLKAAGFNAVSTYVEWSYHEPEERQYSFEGDRDVAKFVRLAAEEGLLVLLRPGPYICAERDLGGLPYWLLSKYPEIKLRTTEKDFTKETKIWMKELFKQLSPQLYENGGPIILVQVENEYGSYGSSTEYMEEIRDIILEHVGTSALLYTTDGGSANYFLKGRVQGALTTINFGVEGDQSKAFAELRNFMPTGPLMNSEFYPGWLTHWGESLQHTDTGAVVAGLYDMINATVNVNVYPFFGGTNFEFTTGANHENDTIPYQPTITSYDYDAPLNEAGDPTPKYYAIRDLMSQYIPDLNNTPVPTPSLKGAYGELALSVELNLLSMEGRSILGKRYKDVNNDKLPTFEALRQRAGLVLYETTLDDSDGVLEITKPRDWIYVYVDGQLAGNLNRMNLVHNLTLKSKPGSKLSLLVENQGRINFGQLLHDFKGILDVVEYKNITLRGPWSITGFPLEKIPSNLNLDLNQPCLAHGPVLYKNDFVLPNGKQPLDTFLDTTGWGRGYAWINGHNLGRYWPGLGPQVTLFVPGAWLLAPPAVNRLRLLELERAPQPLSVQLIDYPILNRTKTF